MPVTPRPSNLLKQRLDRFARALGGVEEGDVKALHRARVASRRLRELIPVLPLDAGAARKLNRRLRKITRRLGTVRELDVLLLLIDELQLSRPNHGEALAHVRHAVSRARDERRRELADDLPIADLRRVARKLRSTVEQLQDGEDNSRHTSKKPLRSRASAWAIDARVARRARMLAEAIDAAGAVYLPERLHDVRIALKKLRYSLELSIHPANQKHSASVRTLKRLQDLLGRMHDLQVLMERTREVQAALAPPSLSAWRELDVLVVSLDEACRRLHARYVREREAVEAIALRLAKSGAAAPRSERRAG